MARFQKNGSLKGFQNFIREVYGYSDDRLFSIFDLLSHQERFTMRALKGIRKGDREKIKHNLLIAFSWTMAIANRLHIDTETTTWCRFPALCFYCGKRPCVCKAKKPRRPAKIRRVERLRPKTLLGFQAMFEIIYPARTRTLEHAGVHLAEETGEISEAIHAFMGEHKAQQFKNIEEEIADYLACIFGVANSASISIASELGALFTNNCHVCHQAPCLCKFSSIVQFTS